MVRWRPIPLAWKNLTHDRWRLLIRLGGINFAIVLMFMEMGFLCLAPDSTLEIIRRLDGEIILVNKARHPLLSPHKFSHRHLVQVEGCSGVKSVSPAYIETLRSVLYYHNRKGQPVRVVACDLQDNVFGFSEIAEHYHALQRPNTALVDSRSKPEIYKGVPQPNTELAGRAIRLVGTFEMCTDFATNGTLLMSTRNFARYFPGRVVGGDPLSQVDVGVVKLEDGVDPKLVKQQIVGILPEGIDVFTKKDFHRRERDFWLVSTPVGFVFFLGWASGFVVGVIICYQIIFSDIADHMAEFATLKAMGYRKRYFVGLVLKEAIYLSVLSFLPGLLISWGLYWWLAQGTKLLFVPDILRAGIVFLSTVLMCVLSGCLAMRKLLAADPADLF